MATDAYSLKEMKNTGELHLFKGEMYPPGGEFKCWTAKKSICQKMLKEESSRNVFACMTEQQAREQCASVGRAVCGVCVSSLYATYE